MGSYRPQVQGIAAGPTAAPAAGGQCPHQQPTQQPMQQPMQQQYQVGPIQMPTTFLGGQLPSYSPMGGYGSPQMKQLMSMGGFGGGGMMATMGANGQPVVQAGAPRPLNTPTPAVAQPTPVMKSFPAMPQGGGMMATMGANGQPVVQAGNGQGQALSFQPPTLEGGLMFSM